MFRCPRKEEGLGVRFLQRSERDLTPNSILKERGFEGLHTFIQQRQNLITPSISRRLTFVSIQNWTGSVEANRAFCWLNPTRAKFCPTGNSKPQTLLASLLTQSTACFSNTKLKAISLAWTWHENCYRCATPALVAMPIISQDAGMQQALKRF